MALYKWHREADAGSTTQKTIIQIAAAAGTSVELTRLFVAANGAAVDDGCRVEVFRMTTASTLGSAAVTSIKLHPNDRASGATVKDSSTAFTQGTNGDLLLVRDFNSRGGIEWVPRQDAEKMETAVAGTIEIMITQSTAFTLDLDLEWEE